MPFEKENVDAGENEGKSVFSFPEHFTECCKSPRQAVQIKMAKDERISSWKDQMKCSSVLSHFLDFKSTVKEDIGEWKFSCNNTIMVL